MPKELVFTGPREIGFREFPQKEPGPGEILVETILSGISHGTEMAFYRGTAPHLKRHPEGGLFVDGPAFEYPFSYGYEEVGRVVKVGPDVEGIHEGDLVAAAYGHRESAVIRPEGAFFTLLPPGTDPELGIFQALGSVSLDAILSADLKVGESCVIFGLGVIGLLCVQLAKMAGAEPVIAVEPLASRRALAGKWGADLLLDPSGDDVGLRVREATGGRKADCALECSGSYKALHESIRCCASSYGRVVAVAFYQGTPTDLYLGEEFHHSSHLIGGAGRILAVNHRLPPAPGRAWDGPRVVSTITRWIFSGRVRVDGLITDRFPFAQAADAFRRVDEHAEECIKVILTF